MTDGKAGATIIMPAQLSITAARIKKTLYLELGVGLNTPGIIKFPFWRAVRGNDSAKYVSVDISPVRAPFDLPGRMFYIDDDIGAVLARVRPILRRLGGKNAD